MAKMIFSDYMGHMIESGFTRIRYNVTTGKVSKMHFTWDETDLLYYSDDVDDEWYDEIPPLEKGFYTNAHGHQIEVFYELDEDEYDDDERGLRMGIDYSPSCPWNAPGMSMSDFF